MACRICYEPEDLIQVCACEGTMKWVHTHCIQQWIDTSHRSHCELCKAPFQHSTLRNPKYIKNKFQWGLLGMGLGCFQTLLLWLVILIAEPNAHHLTLLNLLAIISSIFNLGFFIATITLWIRKKKALPFILSYFTSFIIANVILQSSVHQSELLPFYVATAGLFSVCLLVDFTLFELCERR